MIPIQIDFWSLLLSFAFLISIFVCLVFITKRNDNHAAKVYFVALLIILSALIFNYMVFYTRLYKTFPQLLLTTGWTRWLVGPVFFFYVSSIVNPKFRLVWKDLFHLIPVFYGVYILIGFWSLHPTHKINYFDEILYSENIMLSIQVKINMILNKVHPLAYATYSFFILYKYELRYKEALSNTIITSISFLKKLTLLLGVFFLISLFVIVYLFVTESYFLVPELIVSLILAVFIYILAFAAVKDTDRILPELVEEKKKNTLSENLTAQSDHIIDHLIRLMEEEKVYLNSELKVSDLAGFIEIPKHQLSQVINQKLKTNFFDFINKYRVEEAKVRLADAQYNKYTILSLALDVGFNSKASFNRIFKEYTSLTPSAFRKSTQTNLINN